MSDLHRQRLALVVGIDCYACQPDRRSLFGAVRDAEEVADLLARRFAFPAADVHLLVDEQATRRAVEDELAELGRRATAGAVVVVYWSGHGSRLASEDGAGYDETLVPHDARTGEVRDLRDKELIPYFAELAARGAAVTWIADSCHSGHLYRSRRFGRVRELAPDPPLPPPGAESQPALRGLAAGAGGRPLEVLLAACRASEPAYERPPLQGPHGEWTYALLRVLRDCPSDATARQVVDRARACLVSARVSQDPQVVGARDRLIFGVEARPPVRYVEVRGREKTVVTLAGGAAHGLIAGSLWDVHPPRTYEPSPDAASARLRLVRVGPTSSDAEVDAPATTPETTSATTTARRRIAKGDWAFEAVPAYGEGRLAVRLVGESGDAPSWPALEPLVTGSPVLRWAAPDDEDCVSIELASGQGSIFDERGLPLLGPLSAGDPRTPGAVLTRLEKRARCRHGLRLENRDPTSRVAGSLRFRLLRRDASGAWGPASGPATAGVEGGADLQPAADVPEYRPGDLLAFEVEHDFAGELHVTVLDFGLTDGVAQLFPRPGGEEEPLRRGARLQFGTRPGDELRLYWPDLPHGDDGIGALKLFATTQATDFDWLTAARWPAKRDAGPTSLARLLSMGDAGPQHRAGGEDWGTALVAFRLRR